MRTLALALGAVAFVATVDAAAAPALGTLEDPIPLPENPFVVRGTTVDQPNAIDAYDCDASIDETGGEVVYVFEAPHAGKLTAWVEGDGDGVDVDVHVLDAAELDGSTALGCVARANIITEPAVQAGPVYLAVDTYGGPAQEGPFVLHVTLIGDAWTEYEAYEGVTWRARRYADFGGGRQVVNELRIDPTNPAVSIQSLRSNGCQTVSTMASMNGAVAAINGGYFGPGCAPVSLLKHEGEILGYNGSNRSAFGFDAEVTPMIKRVAPQTDWPEAVEAQGGGPRLVTASTPNDEDDYTAESVIDPGFIGPNPRTVAGIAADGMVSMFGADGRTPALGLSLPAAAALSIDELELVDVVNLDGGGSTTVYVLGMTPNGVVNYPSDSSVNEPADHTGSRAVSGGFFIFSEPKNFAPVITTTPAATADLQAAFIYDADAYDRNPFDDITFSLNDAPEGMTVDAATGEVTWDPPAVYPSSIAVTLIASDGKADTTQVLSMMVPGGVETTSSGVGGGASGGAGEGGGDGDGAGTDDAGCDCATTGTTSGRPGQFALALLGLLVLRRRAFARRGLR